MSVTVVIDPLWGDWGKGRVVDVLAEQANAVIRFGGGSNAGYTVVVGDKTHKLHLCPAGILREGLINIVGPTVFFDLHVGVQEIRLAKEHRSSVLLDASAPVVLPIHRAIDAGRERAAGKEKIGTTKRGIGPASADFWLRRGLTLGDLRSRAYVKAALLRGGYWGEMTTIARYLGVGGPVDVANSELNIDSLSFEATVRWCMDDAGLIFEHVCDTRQIVHHLHTAGRSLVFQGVNGVLLDGIQGTRPYCTSSLCTPAGVSASFGIYRFDRVIGVAKAYPTRVGEGPFPTELNGSIEDQLRRQGNEFGTTTGRPRRCGNPDLAALQYGCRMGGVTELVVTKLDALTGLPWLCACDRYEGCDQTSTLTTEVMSTVDPHYVYLQAWKDDLRSVRSVAQLPESAKRLLGMMEKATGLPIKGVSVGPEREEMFWID